MAVSIVMPCYNEEEVIEKVVRSYYNEVISKIAGSEFIVIDDCSTDNTRNILQRLADEFPGLKVIKTPANTGHGKAMRIGYEYAQKEWAFQVDSDNQFEPDDFRKLYKYRDNYDFILGFRKKRHDPLHRLFLTTIIRLMNFILFGMRIKDANCPFRLIKREILKELIGSIGKEAIAPNIMLSIVARKKEISMIEVPVAHHARETGTVSIANWKLIKLAAKGFSQILKLKKDIK